MKKQLAALGRRRASLTPGRRRASLTLDRRHASLALDRRHASLALGVAAAGAMAAVAARDARAVANDPARVWLTDPPEGRKLDVRGSDGTRLHVDVLGPEDAPTVVLV